MIRLALVRTEKQKNYMLQKGEKIDFKCTAMLNFYSLCERFICQAKTFFFGFSLFLYEKSPLCGSQLVPTLLVLLTLFFRVPEYSLFTCTYVRIFHCHRQRFWPQKVSALSAHSNPNSNLHILLATTSFGNSFLVRG